MCEALDYHEGCFSIGGRLITNFRFANYIVANADHEGRIQAIEVRCYRRRLNITYKDHVTN